MTLTTTVYLICFAPGIPRGNGARVPHYLGSTSMDVHERLAVHLAGKGSPLVKAAADRGLEPRVVRTWPGCKRDERGLKSRHNLAALCPHCGPAFRERTRRAQRARRAAEKKARETAEAIGLHPQNAMTGRSQNARRSKAGAPRAQDRAA